MNRPEDFELTTDYATIKNDGADSSLTVTIPSSVTVAGGAIYNQSSVVTVGSVSSNIRAQIRSSKDGRWVSCAALSITRLGSIPGAPNQATYDVLVTVTRQSNTEVRLDAFVRNPYASTLTGASGAETFYAEVRTFLSPFV